MGRYGTGERAMRGLRLHLAERLCVTVALLVISGCAIADFDLEPTEAGPGVPRISNFRIEPPVVDRGGQAVLRFDFRDDDGDVMDIYLGVRGEVKDFTFATGLASTLLSRGRYYGQKEGTAAEAITISIERRFAPLTSEEREYQGLAVEPERTQQEIAGIRIYEVFVVDEKGQLSNRLQARVTVQ